MCAYDGYILDCALRYTYSEAGQTLAAVLEQAESTGKVLIRRKDGRIFALIPEKT